MSTRLSAGSVLLSVVMCSCADERPAATESPAETPLVDDVREHAVPLDDLAERLGVPELYLVERDILVTDLEQFAAHTSLAPTLFDEVGNPKLIGHAEPHDLNHTMHWNGRRWRLTYCIDNDWEPYGKQQVVDAMAQATAAWETAGVDFVYRPELDYRCNDAEDEVLFRVVYLRSAAALLFRAMGFLPDAPVETRMLAVTFTGIDPLFLEPEQGHHGYTLTRILTHELGHILGFRHEHIREGTTCSDESEPWVPLTELDRNSIMYYPACNPSYDTSAGLLTAMDRYGARYVYPRTANPTLRCGDGVKDPGEACDDGNNVARDGCVDGCFAIEPGFVCATPGMPCTLPHCGNGVVNTGELCDGTPGCPFACTSPIFDPQHPSGSFCLASGYRCGVGEGDCDTDADCQPGLVCGQDIGSMYGLDGSMDVCVRNAHCPIFTSASPASTFCNYPGCDCEAGMGDCDAHSDCVAGTYCGTDNGRAYGLPADFDVCVAPTCGDGVKEPGEACDDSNRRSNDGCSASCRIELAYCGNRIIDPGEECDDGNTNRYDGCVNCAEMIICPIHAPNCNDGPPD